MANTKDIDSLLPLRVVLYGDSGTGKTLLASTFPRPYFIDTDNGMKTLQGMDIEYEQFLEGAEDYGKVYKKTVDKINECIKELPPDGTLVLDSLTRINRQAYHLAEKTSKDGFDKWGMTLEYTTRIVDTLMTAPFNVVLICQEARVMDGELLLGYEPNMYGKSSIEVPHSVDELWRLSVDATGKRFIQTDKTGKVKAKSRLNRRGIIDKVVPWVWDEANPHTNPIFEAVRNAENAKQK